ncbi:unnamed protein product, partial [Cyprideis torosa]
MAIVAIGMVPKSDMAMGILSLARGAVNTAATKAGAVATGGSAALLSGGLLTGLLLDEEPAGFLSLEELEIARGRKSKIDESEVPRRRSGIRRWIPPSERNRLDGDHKPFERREKAILVSSSS